MDQKKWQIPCANAAYNGATAGFSQPPSTMLSLTAGLLGHRLLARLYEAETRTMFWKSAKPGRMLLQGVAGPALNDEDDKWLCRNQRETEPQVSRGCIIHLSYSIGLHYSFKNHLIIATRYIQDQENCRSSPSLEPIQNLLFLRHLDPKPETIVYEDILIATKLCIAHGRTLTCLISLLELCNISNDQLYKAGCVGSWPVD